MHRILNRSILPIAALSLLLLAPAAARSQFGDGLFGGPMGPGAGDPVVSVAAQFTAPTSEEPARLFITATVRPGWHIYSMTQAAGGPVPTRIKLEPSTDFRLAGDFQVDPQPEKKPEPVFNNLVVESHEGTVVWHAPLELSGGAEAGTLEIQGSLYAQPCDAASCLPPQDFSFTAVLGSGVAITEVAAPDTSGSEASEALDPEKLKQNITAEIQQQSLIEIVLAAFLGGIILNLMPCVLPVIGLKIMSFVEQAGQDRRQALLLNVWYSLGLMAVFLILASLAVFLNLGWGHLFRYAGFNVVMAGVVFAMGLSFLGVWEIPIPGFVGSGKTAELAQKEGFGGAFSKGALTTVLATPCTGPFMGSALAWAANQPPLNTYIVFASLGLGMASPYLLIGAFPTLIRFLPKPGAWMETFKQIMGFVLMGTVVYIFTFLESQYVVPAIGLLFALWVSCWWIGRTPPVASPGEKLRAWLTAVAFAGAMWIVLFPGTDEIFSAELPRGIHWIKFRGLRDVMEGRLERTVELEIARTIHNLNEDDPSAASGSRPGAGEKGGSEHELPWQPFTSRRDLETLAAEQKTVLIDFTADWCATCKTLEAAILNTPDVQSAVRELGVVTLQADWTHEAPEVTAMLDLLGARQVPVVAIFPAGNPNAPIIFRGGYTKQSILDALKKAGPSKSAS